MDQQGRGQSQGEGAATETETQSSMLDVLSLPDEERAIVQFLLRQGASNIATIMTCSLQGEPETRALVETLTTKGFLEQSEDDGEARWRARFAPKKNRQVSRNIWSVLDDK